MKNSCKNVFWCVTALIWFWSNHFLKQPLTWWGIYFYLAPYQETYHLMMHASFTRKHIFESHYLDDMSAGWKMQSGQMLPSRSMGLPTCGIYSIKRMYACSFEASGHGMQASKQHTWKGTYYMLSGLSTHFLSVQVIQQQACKIKEQTVIITTPTNLPKVQGKILKGTTQLLLMLCSTV